MLLGLVFRLDRQVDLAGLAIDVDDQRLDRIAILEEGAQVFDAVTRGSLADGAKLEIVIVDGGGLCMNCGQTVQIAQVHDACPACGGYPVNPTAGTDMRITELEVE